MYRPVSPVSAYQGRFAPSPSGALHLGSLLTAVGSFLHARHHNGCWRVRIEDLDRPRVLAGASAAILNTLEYFGMQWDGEVLYQSQRLAYYADVLEQLRQQHKVYPCVCTRQQLAGKIYDGRCRAGIPKSNQAQAWRLQVAGEIQFHDEIQGKFTQDLSRELGDFILKRRDGIFAYQLAVVVDDALQGITHIVRGADLLDNTPRQIYLQQLLNYPTPHYAHLPLLLDEHGRKLSKQNHAAPIATQRPQNLLWQVLKLLGQNPPEHLLETNLSEFWAHSILHWNVQNIPQHLSISVCQLPPV